MTSFRVIRKIGVFVRACQTECRTLLAPTGHKIHGGKVVPGHHNSPSIKLGQDPQR
jgi:hypothetical protein